MTGSPAPLLQTRRLLEVPRDRRRPDGELEGVVLEGRDDDGHGGVGLVLLGPGVEILAEGHQIEPVLTQGGPHRRCRPSSPGWNR